MSNIQKGSGRRKEPLDHFIFSMGEIGRLQTLSVVPVKGGDSFSSELVGSLKLSPLRRGLSLDSRYDVFSFYVPHRYAYGNDDWQQFLMDGVNAENLPAGESVDWRNSHHLNHLGQSVPDMSGGDLDLPKWLTYGYESIFNNYFKYPWAEDINQTLNDMDENTGNYGYPCAHLKTIWNTPLPPERGNRDFTISMDGSDGTLNLQDLNQAYGALHSQQQRELFQTRFRDVVKGLGGSTNADVDFRPTLLKRTQSWASGYDVDGTDEVSLGQYVGRVNQFIDHRVPRFFCPEHGSIWTVAVLRFPPIHRQEMNYLCKKARPSYADLIGDPSVVANHPTVELALSDLFAWEAGNANSTPIGKYPHSQWYRYQAPVVHGRYSDLQGFPFLGGDEPFPIENGLPRYIISDNYNEIFQTTQQAHWQFSGTNKASAIRELPTATESIMTS